MTTPISVTIDGSGIHAPPFDVILAYLQGRFRTIYGADLDLDADTQDGQMIGIFADIINDANNACVGAFDSFRPTWAVGAGLSSIVKINGIRRLVATSSMVVLTLVGQAGTTITNGRVSDNLNLNSTWLIIGTVIIPPSGQIDVLALCLQPGAVAADAGTLTNIVNPQPGWQTATNNAAAVEGQPVETDAALRRRQTKSTAIPALTVLESMQGNLLNTTGVSRAKVYQNDTGVTDPQGIPPRSIVAVVQGGDPVTVATTIANTKTPGVPTYGDTTVVVLDQNNVPDQINYWQLIDQTITVLVYYTAVYGYTDQIGQQLQDSVAQYMDNLDIGQDVLLGDVYSPANLDGDSATEATGLTQAQLDPLGATYSINAPYGLALARPDMVVVGGPYPAGTTTINVQNVVYFSVGDAIWITLDDTTTYRTTIIGLTAATNSIAFADPVPGIRQVVAGGLVFRVGDIPIVFNEAAAATPANVILNVSP